MPVDISAWELSRMLIALLIGIALVAIPAAVLLVRARRRESRLRRQIARLTTSQALLGGPNRSGSPRRDEAGEPNPVVAAQAEFEPNGWDGASAAPASGAAPMVPEPVPVGPVADVPVAHLPGDGNVSPHGRAAGAGAAPFAPAPVYPDPPTQPDHGDQVTRQSPQAADPGGQPQEPQAAAATFASEESAERFRRDYTDPMEQHRRRLAELRSQLGDVPIDQGTNPVHNG